MLIVDNHPFFAACLRSLLDAEADLTVCDVAPDATGLAERVAQRQPDVLVMDLSLGPDSGLEIGTRLRQTGIATPILFVSTLVSPTADQLARVGRCAFVPKAWKPADFLAELHALLKPAAPARPPISMSARRPDEQSHHPLMQRRYLIVDDDPAVVEYIAGSLECDGHGVMKAHTVGEARALLAAQPDDDLCVIVDIVLDNESGIDFAHELLREHPRFGVLFISGFTDDVVVLEPEFADRIGFLGKPFTKEGLQAALEKVCA